MFKTPLAVPPRDAAPTNVAEALTRLTDAQELPFHGWDRAYCARIQNLAGWLHCAVMWRGQDLTEAADIPEGGGQVVLHALIDAHAAMLARHEAELAPYKDADGALLGEEYDEHDKVADRHIEEVVEMLGLVMAVLVGEFGRPTSTP
ncbi:hypothetical protein [Streptomyces albipurpureus]|uniref:Uncharacterized protein n=1 Tax=Streptomyces albipurpureus TaxID=2897419 RepID=A0ABT0UVI8_9ACTN|nr:hypothetical protein [Streptomyces sp. CWNU-1]MCM2392587.1 hypothetical protein [Streptomyces sp. CWNU-1]